MGTTAYDALSAAHYFVSAFGYSGEQYTPATGLLSHFAGARPESAIGPLSQRGYRPAQRSRNARLQSLRLRRQQSHTLRAGSGRAWVTSQWLLAAAGEQRRGRPILVGLIVSLPAAVTLSGPAVVFLLFSLLLTCFLNDECRPTWADANQLIKQLGSDAVNTVQWTAETLNNAFAKYPLLPENSPALQVFCGAGIGCHWSRHGDRLCSLYLGKRSVDRAGVDPAG
ncbi:MAG: hypothetical protein R2932_47875 [Caldilineaceae bacterium]